MILLCAVVFTQCVLAEPLFNRGVNGKPGICESFKICPNSHTIVKQDKKPEICGFEGMYPIICCQASSKIAAQNRVIGDKSKKFCSKIYTLKVPVTDDDEDNEFYHGVFGGFNAVAVVPHMAALGYGEADNIQWLCGGSLISYKHVLTAAHCLNSRELGNVQFVRLGDLNLKINTDKAKPQNFTVIKRVKHPKHKAPSKYHDIALIELDREVNFSIYVKPACLQVESKIYTKEYTTSGWGRKEFDGITADHLQKVSLHEVVNNKCKEIYKSDINLKNGVVDDWQLCAVKEGADTCQGDSGGPLQVPNENHTDGSSIIGVTSFGKACGISNSPGVYTRVSNYIKWIESIVWPN